jgi:hypothetical protein
LAPLLLLLAAPAQAGSWVLGYDAAPQGMCVSGRAGAVIRGCDVGAADAALGRWSALAAPSAVGVLAALALREATVGPALLEALEGEGRPAVRAAAVPVLVAQAEGDPAMSQLVSRWTAEQPSLLALVVDAAAARAEAGHAVAPAFLTPALAPRQDPELASRAALSLGRLADVDALPLLRGRPLAGYFVDGILLRHQDGWGRVGDRALLEALAQEPGPVGARVRRLLPCFDEQFPP